MEYQDAKSRWQTLSHPREANCQSGNASSQKRRKRGALPSAGLRDQREHHLNTIKRREKVQDENWINSIARQRPTKTLLSLFAIGSHFGKLSVTRRSESWRERGYPAACVSSREHRLSLVQRLGRSKLENPITSIARMKPSKTLSSLFAADVPFPKLDAVRSNPISRSMFSIT
jgi:hypothetical protein